MTDLAETILIGILTGLAAEALWEGGKWTVRNRETILNTLRTDTEQPVEISMKVASVSSASFKVTVDNERPTPSLARRLEELAAWYLNVS